MDQATRAWRTLGSGIGILTILVVALYAAFGLTIKVSSAVPGAAVTLGLAGLYLIYAHLRPDPRLAALGAGSALLIAYTHVGAALSYALTALDWPLLDPHFAAMDRHMGFDWMGYLAWTAANPSIARGLRTAYFCSMFQTVAVIIALALLGQISRLIVFLWLFIVTSMAVILLSGVLPAAGAFVYHEPPAALRAVVGLDAGVWHLDQFEALRRGSLTVIDFAKLEGLVTFPSFHTALAIICAWGFWTVRYARWPMAVLSAVIIASTPNIGGHYLVDLIAGGALAVVAILVVNRYGWFEAGLMARVSAAESPTVSTGVVGA
jgi:membrane-associated phospholipid phosphatase